MSRDRIVELRRVKASELQPAENNWRLHPEHQRTLLRALIGEIGYAAPLVAREAADGSLVLIDGHLRAELTPDAEVPVVVVDLTEAEADKVLATLDTVGAMADRDDEELSALLASLEWDNAGLPDLVMDAIPAFDNGNVPKSDERVPDDVPETPEEPIAQLGDIWLLRGATGVEHRVLCADVFDRDQRLPLFDGVGEVDMVATDPPYAIYGSATGIGSDIADDKMVRPFFEQLARLCHAHVREFGHVYWCCDWRSWAAIWESVKRGGLSAKNCIVWDKGSSGLGVSYANTYELVGFFAKLPPQKTMTSGARTGQRQVHRPNVFRCNRVSGKKRQHNAAKPVELMEELLTNSSDDGGSVLDPFLGSGTTIIAAERIGRRCLGIDIEPKWVDVSVQRWADYTKRDPVRHADGAKWSELVAARS